MKFYLCTINTPNEMLNKIAHASGCYENRFLFSTIRKPGTEYVLVNLTPEDISYLILHGSYIKELVHSEISDIIFRSIR